MPLSQPNYLRTRADGSIGAMFPGGVEVPGNAGFGTPDVNQAISWTDGPGGSLIAQVYGAISGGDTALHMGAVPVGGSLGGPGAVGLLFYQGGPLLQLTAQISARNFRIADESARSSFIQNGGNTFQRVNIAGGIITWNAGIPTINNAYGGLAGAVNLGGGVCRVTFADNAVVGPTAAFSIKVAPYNWTVPCLFNTVSISGNPLTVDVGGVNLGGAGINAHFNIEVTYTKTP